MSGSGTSARSVALAALAVTVLAALAIRGHDAASSHVFETVRDFPAHASARSLLHRLWPLLGPTLAALPLIFVATALRVRGIRRPLNDVGMLACAVLFPITLAVTFELGRSDALRAFHTWWALAPDDRWLSNGDLTQELEPMLVTSWWMIAACLAACATAALLATRTRRDRRLRRIRRLGMRLRPFVFTGLSLGALATAAHLGFFARQNCLCLAQRSVAWPTDYPLLDDLGRYWWLLLGAALTLPAAGLLVLAPVRGWTRRQKRWRLGAWLAGALMSGVFAWSGRAIADDAEVAGWFCLLPPACIAFAAILHAVHQRLRPLTTTRHTVLFLCAVGLGAATVDSVLWTWSRSTMQVRQYVPGPGGIVLRLDTRISGRRIGYDGGQRWNRSYRWQPIRTRAFVCRDVARGEWSALRLRTPDGTPLDLAADPIWDVDHGWVNAAGEVFLELENPDCRSTRRARIARVDPRSLPRTLHRDGPMHRVFRDHYWQCPLGATYGVSPFGIVRVDAAGDIESLAWQPDGQGCFRRFHDRRDHPEELGRFRPPFRFDRIDVRSRTCNHRRRTELAETRGMLYLEGDRYVGVYWSGVQYLRAGESTPTRFRHVFGHFGADTKRLVQLTAVDPDGDVWAFFGTAGFSPAAPSLRFSWDDLTRGTGQPSWWLRCNPRRIAHLLREGHPPAVLVR